MALRVQDVITEDFVRDTVEEVVEADLVYRQVFDSINATGISSNAYTFNIAEDNMGRVQVVPEGAEVPRHQSSVEQVTVTFDKFAGEVSLTMEAQEDGMLDMKARQVEDLGRAMDETLDNEARLELDGNVKQDLENHSNGTIGENGGTMAFADLRDAIIEVRRGNYGPDTLILDLNAYSDLMTDEYFNRATSGGDAGVVETGQLGEVAGLNLIVDNNHDIGTDGHGGYLIDTDRFGYEMRRTPMATTRYDDPERMADVIQAYTRRTWKALFSDAAVKIDA